VQKTVSLARESFALVKKSFERGLSTSLDVIDANNMLNGAELGLASERFNNDTKVLALLLALGRMPEALGVTDVEEEPAPLQEADEDQDDEDERGRPLHPLGGEIPLPPTAPGPGN
jgi:hypothetical protein